MWEIYAASGRIGFFTSVTHDPIAPNVLASNRRHDGASDRVAEEAGRSAAEAKRLRVHRSRVDVKRGRSLPLSRRVRIIKSRRGTIRELF